MKKIYKYLVEYDKDMSAHLTYCWINADQKKNLDMTFPPWDYQLKNSDV